MEDYPRTRSLGIIIISPPTSVAVGISYGVKLVTRANPRSQYNTPLPTSKGRRAFEPQLIAAQQNLLWQPPLPDRHQTRPPSLESEIPRWSHNSRTSTKQLPAVRPPTTLPQRHHPVEHRTPGTTPKVQTSLVEVDRIPARHRRLSDQVQPIAANSRATPGHRPATQAVNYPVTPLLTWTTNNNPPSLEVREATWPRNRRLPWGKLPSTHSWPRC